MLINAILLLILTCCGSFASIQLKKASGSENILKCKYLYFGVMCYGMSFLINIYLLRVAPYTVIFPLTSLTYLWTVFLGHKFFGEKITGRKITGIILIIMGAVVIANFA